MLLKRSGKNLTVALFDTKIQDTVILILDAAYVYVYQIILTYYKWTVLKTTYKNAILFLNIFLILNITDNCHEL